MELEDKIELEKPDSELREVKIPEKNSHMQILKVISGLLLSLVVVMGYLIYTINQPADYALPTTFTVENGASVRVITAEMKQQGLVKSDTFLYLLLVSFFDPTSIKASTYSIDEHLTSYELAKKLVEGDFASDLVRFTHFEGEPVSKIAENAEKQLVEFDKTKFLDLAIPQEGRLFPDTYLVPKTFSAESLFELMTASFDEAIQPLAAQIEESSLPLDEIIILASIIEREANSPESMKLVASVFSNRLAIGMPLQADASIEYILNKPLKELTAADLEIDSPYNTYLNPGLPPTPIGNPGIAAITAVLEPTESDYFYYITDNDGGFHFSITYEEHLYNVNLYLR